MREEISEADEAPDTPARGVRAPQVWSVQALLLAASDALTARFGATVVQGEISGFTRATSGHCYFSLKDESGGTASIRCAMFRRVASTLTVAPRDGMRVLLRGRVAVYEARGELQLVVEGLRLAGEGALYEQFLRLRAKLLAEGWFDTARKRALPEHVRRVGIVTSLGAAALHDVATALARRSPHVEAVIYPSLVQGAEAPAALVQALALANRRAEVDVILLVRGGGSLEDLWAFNDESVVRAVAASKLPVVVGVGHESDVTLADLVADLRAATPTAAAELAVPRTDELLAALAAQHERVARSVQRRLEQQALRLDRAAQRAGRPALGVAAHRERLAHWQATLAPRVQATLTAQSQRLDRLGLRAQAAMTRRQELQAQRLAQWAARLSSVDPSRVLRRGYAWITDAEGKPLQSTQAVVPGDAIRAVLADGSIDAAVIAVDRQAKPI